MPKQDQRQISQVRASQCPDWRGHGSLWARCVSGHGRVMDVEWVELCAAQSSRSKWIGRMKKSFALIVLCTHPCTHVQISPIPIPAADGHSDRDREVKEQSSPRQWGFHTGWAQECHCMSTVHRPRRETPLQHTFCPVLIRITFSHASRPSDTYFWLIYQILVQVWIRIIYITISCLFWWFIWVTQSVKGALCSSGKEIQNSWEFWYLRHFHKWINKLLSEEHKVPKHRLKLERWQGPPHINKMCCSLRSICLFSLFSHKNKEIIVHLICLGIKN